MKTYFSKLKTGLLAILLVFGGGLLAQPANDDLCNAISLVVGAGCNGLPNGDNTGATFQTGEPSPACFSGGVNSVWFQFVGPASGLVSISTNYNIGTNDDTEIALYALNSGQCTNPSGLLLIDCKQDDFQPPSLFNSTIEQAPVIPGNTYYIAVSGWNNTQGTFCLTVDEVPSPVPAPPANDTLCNAVVLQVDSSCNGLTNGTNLNAFYEVGEPLGSCTNDDNTVWYSFVAPTAGAVEITTDVNVGGTNTQSAVTLFALPGGLCTNLSDLFEVACARGNGTNGSSIDTTRVVPGQTYYVAVSGGSGSFCLEVSSAPGIVYPVNDNLCDAISLTVGAACTTNYDNTNATLEVGEPTPGCFVGANNSVWFSFVGTTSGAASITTDIDSMGTNDDTEIAVYALPGGNCANLADLVLLDCSQDNGSTVPFNGFIEGVPVSAGVTYYVQVSGYNNTQGTFCIEVDEEFVPANDDVCDAIDLPVDGVTRDFFNLSSSIEPGEDTLVVVPRGDGNGRFAWFENVLRTTTWHTFVAPSSGAVRIDLCNGGNGTTDFDTQVAVFSGDSCSGFSNFTFLGGNDDDSTGCTTNQNRFASVLDVTCLVPGETYFIVVDGFQNQSGLYSISVSEVILEPLELAFDFDNPTCADDQDGQIRVSPSGGALPYLYSWSNGPTVPVNDSIGLGTYQVTITDFCGDVLLDSLSLLPQPPLDTRMVTDEVSCAGDSTGQVLVVGGGGRGPYSYLWNTGDSTALISDLKAGTYTLTLTDACDTSRVVVAELVEPGALEAEAGEARFFCDLSSGPVSLGDSITASGGSFQPKSPRAYGFAFNSSLGIFQHEVNRSVSAASLLASVDTFTAGDFVGDSLFLTGVDSTNGGLYTFNEDSSRIEKVASLPTGADQLWTGLAFDPSRSKLLGLRVGAGRSVLFEINPVDGRADSLGEIMIEFPIWLAINELGEMYSLDLNSDEIFSIDTASMESRSLGSVGFDANFLQDADFDPETGLLYLSAFNDSTDRAEYRVIDLQLGTESTLIDTFPENASISAYGILPQGPDMDLFTYSWEPSLGLDDSTLANPSLSYILDTTYVLTVFDACGNVAMDSVVVQLSDNLSVDTVTTVGDTSRAVVSGGIPPYSYSWSNGASTSEVIGLGSGPNSVTVTDSIGCTATFDFSITVGLEENLNLKSMELYPNPNGGRFVLQAELSQAEELRISIYGMNGKEVFSKKLGQKTLVQEPLDLSHLAKGVYKLTLYSGTGFQSRSFIVR